MTSLYIKEEILSLTACDLHLERGKIAYGSGIPDYNPQSRR